jgi:hypothetical protein
MRSSVARFGGVTKKITHRRTSRLIFYGTCRNIGISDGDCRKRFPTAKSSSASTIRCCGSWANLGALRRSLLSLAA